MTGERTIIILGGNFDMYFVEPTHKKLENSA